MKASVASTKDLRVSVRLRNNRLLECREALGFNQHEAALAIGIGLGAYSDFETMKRKPIIDGKWDPLALKVADYYDQPIEELFPESVLAIQVPHVERKVDASDLLPLLASQHTERLLLPPDTRTTAEELQARVELALKSLSPRKEKVLRDHFGFESDERSYKDIAKDFNCTGGNISMVANDALRTLARHRKLLTDFDDDDAFWDFAAKTKTRPEDIIRSYSPASPVPLDKKCKAQYALSNDFLRAAFTLFEPPIVTQPTNVEQRHSFRGVDGPIVDLFLCQPDLNEEFRRFRRSLFEWFPRRTRLALKWGAEGNTELLLICLVLVRPTTKMVLRAMTRCRKFWSKSSQGELVRWRVALENDSRVRRTLRTLKDLVSEAVFYGYDNARIDVDGDYVVIDLSDEWTLTEQGVHLRCCFQDRATVVAVNVRSRQIYLKLKAKARTEQKLPEKG
jgi:transcriptional regulator with XRE-family HTH domain